MFTTETFIAIAGAVLLMAGLLLTVSWVPWGLAALQYRSPLVPAILRRSMAYLATVLSIVALVELLIRPSFLQYVPPLSRFIDQALSDPSLAPLSEPAHATLRSVLLAECVMALLLPILLIACLLLGGFCNLLISPPLRILRRFRESKWCAPRTIPPVPPIPYAERLQRSSQQAQEEHEAELAAIDALPLSELEKQSARNESKRKLLQKLKRYVSPDDGPRPNN